MSWRDRDYNRDEFDGTPGFGLRRGWSATTWIIITCVVAFLLDAIIARTMGRMPTIANGPLTDWGAFTAADAVFRGQVWRFITFQFLHGGIGHVLFNMLALFYFGRMIEGTIGTRRYVAFYLLCGVAGAAFYMVLLLAGYLVGTTRVPMVIIHDPSLQLVGASAGIFGVLVAAAVLYPTQRVQLLFPPISVTIRALVIFMVSMAAIIVLIGGENTGGEAAHLGGAALGFFLIRKVHWLNFLDRFALPDVKATRRRRERESAEREDAEVDRILDKVRAHGLHSLTKAEQKTLRRATDRQRRAG